MITDIIMITKILKIMAKGKKIKCLFLIKNKKRLSLVQVLYKETIYDLKKLIYLYTYLSIREIILKYCNFTSA